MCVDNKPFKFGPTHQCGSGGVVTIIRGGVATTIVGRVATTFGWGCGPRRSGVELHQITALAFPCPAKREVSLQQTPSPRRNLLTTSLPPFPVDTAFPAWETVSQQVILLYSWPGVCLEDQEALRMGHLTPMCMQRDVNVVRDTILVGVSADQWRLHCDYKGGRCG